MRKKSDSAYSSPYQFEGRIPLKHAIPLGIQHVLAMFVGNLTPLIIICGACGISADQPGLYVTLLQNAMLVAGLVTLVQLYGIGPIGAAPHAVIEHIEMDKYLPRIALVASAFSRI